ncbi:cytochrome C oxidase subunit IV family protein [Geminicoccus roseus]|uniref:cytochrome C oxidase subunit IV family protein n=1 Tax=Geminicoccus roseus TaxID=404900 RepID=UPI00054EC065|nr:cytochrome C oxidase subunit IV family protein [Geminicoccus roseus]
MTGLRPLLLVWLALLALLAATVAASFVLTGPLAMSTAIAIALAKAGLIFWFFMHLHEASGLIRLVAVGALVWLLILFTLTSADYATRFLF